MIKTIVFWTILVLVAGGVGWGFYKLRDRFDILRDFVRFLAERKLWWLAPILIVFALAGLFVAVTSSSAVSAFIYTLF